MLFPVPGLPSPILARSADTFSPCQSQLGRSLSLLMTPLTLADRLGCFCVTAPTLFCTKLCYILYHATNIGWLIFSFSPNSGPMVS